MGSSIPHKSIVADTDTFSFDLMTCSMNVASRANIWNWLVHNCFKNKNKQLKQTKKTKHKVGLLWVGGTEFEVEVKS